MALIVREQTLRVEALLKVRAALQFLLRGLDTDNDSVFMNDTLISYCRDYDIELTRSRATTRTIKLGSSKRTAPWCGRLVGYQRLEGVAAVQALSECVGVRSHTMAPIYDGRKSMSANREFGDRRLR